MTHTEALETVSCAKCHADHVISRWESTPPGIVMLTYLCGGERIFYAIEHEDGSRSYASDENIVCVPALESTPPTAEPEGMDGYEGDGKISFQGRAYVNDRMEAISEDENGIEPLLFLLVSKIESLRSRLATAEQAGYASGVEDAAEICHKEGEYQGRLGNHIATQMQVDFYKAEALIRALPTTQQKEEPHANN